MTIIEQIKDEVERLKATNPSEYNYQNAEGYVWALDDILSFLSTLESEKPMNQDELAKEYQEFCKDYPFPWSSQYVNREYIDELCLSVARHFAQWGAEHAREQMMEEAVGAEVWGEVYTSRRIVKSDWLGPEIGKPGDKVRIIIVKED